jgi:HSP20 family molecular chaperone IbpA
MFKKKCNVCGSTLEKQWSFCPNCGASCAVRNMGVPGINNINLDLTKVMQQVVGPLLNSAFGGNIFKQKSQPQKQSMQEKFNKNIGNVEEVIEPQDLVSEHGDTIVHAINLPGVKSKSDINITKMENSIEVRALCGKKLYLKIIQREKGEGVVSEDFTQENLILVLKKI